MSLIATVDSYCKGCRHLCGPAESKSCKYLQNVGRRRPCPAGNGCTAHTGRKHGKTSVPAMDEQIAMDAVEVRDLTEVAEAGDEPF